MDLGVMNSDGKTDHKCQETVRNGCHSPSGKFSPKHRTRGNKSKDVFPTDCEISGGTPFQVKSRVLKPWVEGDENVGTVGMRLEDDPKFNRKWDQFQTNKELFQVKSDYDENLYTIPLDRTAPNYREREAVASKLAKKIENSLVSNIYVAEDRIQDLDDCEIDEERMYSSVITSSSTAGIFSKNSQTKKRTFNPSKTEKSPTLVEPATLVEESKQFYPQPKRNDSTSTKRQKNKPGFKKSQHSKDAHGSRLVSSEKPKLGEPREEPSKDMSDAPKPTPSTSNEPTQTSPSNLEAPKKSEVQEKTQVTSVPGLNVYAEEFKPLNFPVYSLEGQQLTQGIIDTSSIPCSYPASDCQLTFEYPRKKGYAVPANIYDQQYVPINEFPGVRVRPQGYAYQIPAYQYEVAPTGAVLATQPKYQPQQLYYSQMMNFNDSNGLNYRKDLQ